MQVKKLGWLGCEVRVIADPRDLETVQKDFDSNVVLFDGTTFDTEGPGIVGAINAAQPAMKVVVLASTDCILEPAYRIRRIFYYAVEPFADNEIADILAGAFQCRPAPCRTNTARPPRRWAAFPSPTRIAPAYGWWPRPDCCGAKKGWANCCVTS